MKKFEVLLTRSYRIEIDANDETRARYLSEFYVGGEKDLSDEHARLQDSFSISEIEMTVNEAIESNEIVNV